jgi:hypothetical protein
LYFEHQAAQVKTFTGAYTNMMDNQRINAGLALQKLFPLFKKLMEAVTAIDLDWLGGAFDKLSAALLYLWDVLKSTDMIAGWEVFKQSIFDLVDALGVMVGGVGGAGDGLKSFGKTLGSLIGMVFRTMAALVYLISYFTKVVGWIREHNMLMTSFLTIMMLFVGAGPAIARVTTLTMGLVSSFTLAGLRAMMLQGTLTSLWEYTKVFGTRSAMNAFFATSQAGMLGLTIATGWAIQKILELHEVMKDNVQVQQQLDYSAWVANKSTAETEVKMAERDMYKFKHGASRDALKESEAQQRFLLHKKELDDLLAHPRVAPNSPEAVQDDLASRLAKQVADAMQPLQKSMDALLDPAQKTARNTAPRSGGFDELQLLNIALRGRLPSELLHTVAEYD